MAKTTAGRGLMQLKMQSRQESSTLASLLTGTVTKAEHWTDDTGRTVIVLEFAKDLRTVIITPNADAKRFDYGQAMQRFYEVEE